MNAMPSGGSPSAPLAMRRLRQATPTLHEVMLTVTISMLRKGAPSMSISCSITLKAKAGSRVPIAHAAA